MKATLSKVHDYFSSAWRSDPAERKLVRKIDFFILTFCCLSYFLNYVSQSTREAQLYV